MNKTKRALQLTGAIISIILGGFLLVWAIFLSTYAPAVLTKLNVINKAEILFEIYVSCGLCILFAFALVIVALFFRTDPIQRNKPTEYKGLTIALLVLNVALLVFICSNFSKIPTVVAIICCLVNIGLFIAVLCIPCELQNTSQNTAVENKQNIQQQNIKSTEQNDTLARGKIRQIRELNRQGVITDSEMKELIIKELNK